MDGGSTYRLVLNPRWETREVGFGGWRLAAAPVFFVVLTYPYVSLITARFLSSCHATWLSSSAVTSFKTGYLSNSIRYYSQHYISFAMFIDLDFVL